MAERDEVISDLEREVSQLRAQFEDVSGSEEDLRREADLARSEVERIRSETQTKINALNAAGVEVAETPTDMGAAMVRAMG